MTERQLLSFLLHIILPRNFCSWDLPWELWLRAITLIRRGLSCIEVNCKTQQIRYLVTIHQFNHSTRYCNWCVFQWLRQSHTKSAFVEQASSRKQSVNRNSCCDRNTRIRNLSNRGIVTRLMIHVLFVSMLFLRLRVIQNLFGLNQSWGVINNLHMNDNKQWNCRNFVPFLKRPI